MNSWNILNFYLWYGEFSTCFINILLYRQNSMFVFDFYGNQTSIHIFWYIDFWNKWNKKLAIPLKGNKKSLYTTSYVCRYIKFSSRTLAISHNNQYKKSKGFLGLINFCTSTKTSIYQTPKFHENLFVFGKSFNWIMLLISVFVYFFLQLFPLMCVVY